MGAEVGRGSLVDGEMGESRTAKQLTLQASRWIQIGSIAWIRRLV